jgi:hypothetical protein
LELRRIASLISVATVFVIAGCGGKGDEPATFTKLTLVVSGGFGAAPPRGSTCDRTLQPLAYAVEASSRQLSFGFCAPTIPGGPWHQQTGQRVLTAAELATIEDGLAQLAPSQAMSCGADAAVVTLDLERARGVELLADDFYSGCPWELHAGRTFVTGLQNLAVVFNALQPT